MRDGLCTYDVRHFLENTNKRSTKKKWYFVERSKSKSKFFIYSGSALSSQASSQALHFKTTLTGSESQLAGGKLGYIQAQPRS